MSEEEDDDSVEETTSPDTEKVKYNRATIHYNMNVRRKAHKKTPKEKYQGLFKKDVVKLVVNETRYPAAAVLEIYNSILRHHAMIVATCVGKHFKMPGLGTFSYKHIEGRWIKHPVTKEPFYRKPRKRVVFTPFITLRNELRKNSIELLEKGEIE